MPTTYILSDLIVFIIYGVTWKWALMDILMLAEMRELCLFHLITELRCHRLNLGSASSQILLEHEQLCMCGPVETVWLCLLSLSLYLLHLQPSAGLCRIFWRRSHIAISCRSMLWSIQKWCWDKKKKTPFFSKYCLVSFLLKKPQPAGQNTPHFGVQLIFLIMNLSSIVTCDLKGLFQPKWFSDFTFAQLVKCLVETYWFINIFN